MVDDAQLLQRYLEDPSQGAFTELVQRHLNLVYFAALRQTGDAHGAKDIAQKVFLHLSRKARSLADRPSLASWLYKTTRFEVAHAARTERRRRERETKAYAMNELWERLEPAANWERLRPEIDEVLHALKDREREAVLLRFFPGITFGDMARRLGLSEDAARFRTERALKKMRALLAKRGIDSTAAALTLALASQAAATPPADLLVGIVSSAAGLGLPASPGVLALQFMSMTKALAAISTLVCLSLAGLALHEHQTAVQAQARAAAETQSYQLEATRLEELRKQVRRESGHVAELSQAVAQAAAAYSGSSRDRSRTAAPQGGPAHRTGRPSPAEPNRELAQDPSYREAYASLRNAATNTIARPIFKALNLSPAQIETFDTLAAEMPPDSPLRPEGMTPADVAKQMQQLLGADGYDEAAALSQTAPMRSVAAGLAGNLYYTDSPLTTEQADQLTLALASTSTAAGPASADTVNWKEALPLAQSILTPAQYSAFQNEVAILSNQSDPNSLLSPITAGAYASGRYPPAGASVVQTSHP